MSGKKDYKGIVCTTENDNSKTFGIISPEDEMFCPTINIREFVHNKDKKRITLHTDNLLNYMLSNDKQIDEAAEMCDKCYELLKANDIETLSQQLYSLCKTLNILQIRHSNSVIMSDALFYTLNSYKNIFDAVPCFDDSTFFKEKEDTTEHENQAD